MYDTAHFPGLLQSLPYKNAIVNQISFMDPNIPFFPSLIEMIQVFCLCE